MIPQRSEAWHLERLGHITGSRFGDVVAVGRSGKPAASRQDVITEVTLELITGRPGPMWSSKATRWGNDHEADARMEFEARTGIMCEEVGFIVHPRHRQVGCSPDHLISTDGGGEIKCPITAKVHMDTLLYGMPAEHIPQVQGGMWCTERDYWDFVSYHKDFPPEMRIYIERIKRDDVFIRDMEDKILNAVAEINLNVRSLLQKYGVKQ